MDMPTTPILSGQLSGKAAESACHFPYAAVAISALAFDNLKTPIPEIAPESTVERTRTARIRRRKGASA
jgi:hypothetical protein